MGLRKCMTSRIRGRGRAWHARAAVAVLVSCTGARRCGRPCRGGAGVRLTRRRLPREAALVPSRAGAVLPLVAGFTYVKSLGGIDEYRLDSNGLTVLLVPDHSAPVVTFQVTYQVGSRNEVTGTTGATHILEHLMFKGSDAFNDPKGNSVKQLLERVGGQFNASTSFDRTNYFATVGRESLEGYIAIEADRMRHLWLHEADRQAEMTVVRNEYERGKNDPDSVLAGGSHGGGLRGAAVSPSDHRLEERHRACAHRASCASSTTRSIGPTMRRSRWSATSTPAAAWNLIKKYYGVYPALAGAHSGDLHRGAGAKRRAPSHRQAPGRTGHGDRRPQGAEWPRCRSAGARDARCHLELGQERAPVSRARRSRSGLERRRGHRSASRPVAAYFVRGALRREPRTSRWRRPCWRKLNKIKTGGVTAGGSGQREAAIHRRRCLQARRHRGGGQRNSTSGSRVGDWTLYVTFPQKVQQVTPADVQRVAKQYFNADQSTIGWFVPVPPKTEKGS